MRSIATFLSMFIAMAAFASGVDDICISFSTKGPDRYSDGSMVLDGECYALVWSEDGNFDGFTADGGCVDTNDRIVLTAPIAKDGHCPPVLFQIPSVDAEELKDGKFAVYLLDTRVSSGGSVKPHGTVNGVANLMNGYGAVSASLMTGENSCQNKAYETVSGSSGNIAASVSAPPADCTQPRIKKMRLEGNNVFLTVENLKGFMRVQSGGDVSASDITGIATETSGTAEDVVLVSPKTGNTGFFKVVRNGSNQ